MRQQRTIGAVVEIPFEQGKKSYARILGEASFAFHDFVRKEDESAPIADVIRSSILFIFAVYDDAVTKGRWKKIGRMPLEVELQTLPLKFIQDPMNKERFEIYDNGQIRPATRAECMGLERAAVWEPEHAESRLSDYYAGKPNKWLKQMQME